MDEVIHSARLRPLMRSSRVQAALHVPFPLLFSSILPVNLLFSVVIFNSLTLFRLHVLAALSWTEPGPRYGRQNPKVQGNLQKVRRQVDANNRAKRRRRDARRRDARQR